MHSKVCFAVLADTHINSSLPFAKRTRMLRTALLNIAKDSFIQGVFLCGDVSDFGMPSQLESFACSIQNFKQKSNKEAYVVLGNHDLYRYIPTHVSVLEMTNEFRESLNEDDQENVYEERCIQGIVILMLQSEHRLRTTSFLSDKQLTWLKTRLIVHKQKQAVFILHHQPLTYTHMGSENYGLGKQNAVVQKLLTQFSNVIWISGHIHNDPSTIRPCINRFGIQVDVPSFQLTKWHGGHTGCGLRLCIQDKYMYYQVYDFINKKAYQSFCINLKSKQLGDKEELGS